MPVRRRTGGLRSDPVQSKRFNSIAKRFSLGRYAISPTLAIASCRCAERIARSSGSSATSLRAVWLSGAIGEIPFRPRGIAARDGLWQALLGNASAGDALDGGPALGELLLQALKAAVEMINTVDHRLAFGRQARDH